MKKFTSVTAALLVGLSAFGASVSMVVPYNTYTNLLSAGPATVTSFTLANGTGTNTFVQFNDSAVTNLYYTNTAWSAITYASSSVTNIYTNYFNVLTTNIYTALVGTSNYVASVTNYNPILLGVAVPSNTTIVLNGRWKFIEGIQITNGLGQLSVTANLQ